MMIEKKETITLTINPVKGQFLYNPSCVSYHNNVPKKLVGIDPQVFGSLKELVLKKINCAKYQKNHKPKRFTKIIPIMPHFV